MARNPLLRQRCRVHFMRNVLSHIPKASKPVVAAALRTMFARPAKAAATQQLRDTATAMASRWPKAGGVVADAEEERAVPRITD